MKYLLFTLLFVFTSTAWAQNNDTSNYVYMAYLGTTTRIIESLAISSGNVCGNHDYWGETFVYNTDRRSYAHTAQAIRLLHGRQNYFSRGMLKDQYNGCRRISHMYICVLIKEDGKPVMKYFVRGFPRCLKFCDELMVDLSKRSVSSTVLCAVKDFQNELKGIPQDYRNPENYFLPAFQRPFCCSDDSIYP